MLTKITYEELLARVNKEARAAVEHWWKMPGTDALVYFENQQPDSPFRGDASVLAVGPQRHVKHTEDVEGTHLNEIPELRQSPRFYCTKNIEDPGH